MNVTASVVSDGFRGVISSSRQASKRVQGYMMAAVIQSIWTGHAAANAPGMWTARLDVDLCSPLFRFGRSRDRIDISLSVCESLDHISLLMDGCLVLGLSDWTTTLRTRTSRGGGWHVDLRALLSVPPLRRIRLPLAAGSVDLPAQPRMDIAAGQSGRRARKCCCTRRARGVAARTDGPHQYTARDGGASDRSIALIDRSQSTQHNRLRSFLLLGWLEHRPLHSSTTGGPSR